MAVVRVRSIGVDGRSDALVRQRVERGDSADTPVDDFAANVGRQFVQTDLFVRLGPLDGVVDLLAHLQVDVLRSLKNKSPIIRLQSVMTKTRLKTNQKDFRITIENELLGLKYFREN